MYAENITTPHPRKQSAEEMPRPLLEKVQVAEVVHELQMAAEDGRESYDAAKIGAAEAITEDVNHALWYPEKVYARDDFKDMDIEHPIALKEIEEKQAANCFGYTVTTSEILDASSIEHWIGYGNGHAFILLPTGAPDSRDGLYMIDPLTPHLNQFIDGSMRRGNVQSVHEQLNEQDRAAFMLDTGHFSSELGHPPDELAKKHPWLVFAKHQTHFQRDHRDVFFNGGDIEERNRLQRMYMIIVSAYESSDGRALIEDYAALQRAVADEDIPQACASFQSMAGVYPELDARQDHGEFRQVIDALLESNQVQLAIDLIEPYFKSFENSGDSRFLEAKADIKRKVASRCGAIALRQEVATNLVNEAVEAYQQAARKPHSFRTRIDGKIEKAKQLAGELVA